MPGDARWLHSCHARHARPGPFRERYRPSPDPLNEAADHQLGVTRPFSPHCAGFPGNVQLQAQVSAQPRRRQWQSRAWYWQSRAWYWRRLLVIPAADITVSDELVRTLRDANQQ